MEKKYGVLRINFYDLTVDEKTMKRVLGYDEDEEVEDIDCEFEEMIDEYDIVEVLNFYDIEVLKREDVSNVEEKYIIKGSEEDIENLRDNFWLLNYEDTCKLEILDTDNLVIKYI